MISDYIWCLFIALTVSLLKYCTFRTSVVFAERKRGITKCTHFFLLEKLETENTQFILIPLDRSISQ